MRRVFIAAAKRSAVIPRGGAFKKLQADEIAAPVISAAIKDAGITGDDIDQVIMGNALYGGGNPARLAALRAGIPETVPAMTLDTQCCSGMDALHYGAALIRSGAVKVVLVGGLESYSRSPIRMHRPTAEGQPAIAYDRPAFTPWKDRDPDMLASAANLAREENCNRQEQQGYAVQSHQKAVDARAKLQPEIVPIEGQCDDGFSRKLSQKILDRLPLICGKAPFELTAATVAVEADAAAALMLIDEDVAKEISSVSIEYIASVSLGTDPTRPALSPIAAIDALLKKTNSRSEEIYAFEVMEAFALQGVLIERYLGGNAARRVNLSGGALARGHPIGASGSINLVRLFNELLSAPEGGRGLSAIAAAGGIGSAVMLQKKKLNNDSVL